MLSDRPLSDLSPIRLSVHAPKPQRAFTAEELRQISRELNADYPAVTDGAGTAGAAATEQNNTESVPAAIQGQRSESSESGEPLLRQPRRRVRLRRSLPAKPKAPRLAGSNVGFGVTPATGLNCIGFAARPAAATPGDAGASRSLACGQASGWRRSRRAISCAA